MNNVSYSNLCKPVFMVPGFFFVLYLTSVFLRPLLPIDETRYLTVAWEMFLRHDWLAPLTVNFEPYHHKPPILFWMINSAWAVFGVNRPAALIPVLVMSIACIFLTRTLAKKIIPDLAERIPLLMLGSVPFLIYSTLILFDISVAVWTLCSLLCLWAYAAQRNMRYIFLLGLCLALGVLTKGPVAYLYVIFPVLLGPFWIAEKGRWASWYCGFFAAVLVSLVPIALWVIPVLKATSDNFAYWLLWEQTAGRITGSHSSGHSRPLWFYLPLLPVMVMPWLFFPAFWKRWNGVKTLVKKDQGFRFLLTWLVPTFLTFSLISGKQPHYLVPLLPGVFIVLAYLLQEVSVKALHRVVGFMLVIFVAGHFVANHKFFHLYDLRPLAGFVASHSDRDWAVARKYHGEITFLGRLEKPIERIESNDVRDWFKAHPDGLVIFRYGNPKEVQAYEMLFSAPYRSTKRIGVFAAPKSWFEKEDLKK